MTTAEDYLDSVLASVKEARKQLSYVSVKPDVLDDKDGYAPAMPNPEDRHAMAMIAHRLADIDYEVREALALMRPDTPVIVPAAQ